MRNPISELFEWMARWRLRRTVARRMRAMFPEVSAVELHGRGEPSGRAGEGAVRSRFAIPALCLAFRPVRASRSGTQLGRVCNPAPRWRSTCPPATPCGQNAIGADGASVVDGLAEERRVDQR